MSNQDNTQNMADDAVTAEMNAFYERADEFIKLANELRTDEVHAGKINASMLYAVARFSAWTAAFTKKPMKPRRMPCFFSNASLYSLRRLMTLVMPVRRPGREQGR